MLGLRKNVILCAGEELIFAVPIQWNTQHDNLFDRHFFTLFASVYLVKLG